MNFRLIRESSLRSRDSFDDVFCDRNNSAAFCIILTLVTFHEKYTIVSQFSLDFVILQIQKAR